MPHTNGTTGFPGCGKVETIIDAWPFGTGRSEGHQVSDRTARGITIPSSSTWIGLTGWRLRIFCVPGRMVPRSPPPDRSRVIGSGERR